MKTTFRIYDDSPLWEHELSMARVYLAFRSGSTTLDDGEYASAFNMPKIWDRLQ